MRAPRGKLARLEALEARDAERRETVRAVNWGHIERAEGLLSPEDRTAWKDAARVVGHGEDPDALERMRRACAHLPEGLPLTHPARVEVEAWAERALDVPEGCPLLAPPAGRGEDFAAYFEACAAWCDLEARRVPLSEDVQRVARWGRSLWRFEAALCRVLGGEA